MQYNLARSFRVSYLKHLAFLLASMLITLSVHATNLVTNPSFEAQPISTDWSVFAGAGSLSSSSESHSGTSSALVSGRTASYGGVSQDLNGVLTAGVTYDISAWVRLANPVTFDISDSTLTDSIKFEMNIKQTDGAGTQYISIDTSAFENVNNWIKLFGQFTYQPTGTVSTLSLYIHGPDAGTDILVDDVAIYAPESYTTTPHTSSDFVRAQGRQLVVGAANAPIRLMGVNFNAYGEEDESADTIFSGNNYDASSYQDVADMGLTVVRLDLWWKLFEDENNPYTYKQAGWDWLNKNINWARDAGVYLILDLHAPHGGFQGPGYSGNFWSNSDQKARTKALWTEIASRYKDEVVIAAYDIFNEPAAPNTSDLIAYSQELVDAIRTVDTNHLLIVEIDYGDNNTGAFLVNDSQSNVMYDFHQYAPWYYSAALGYHYGYGDYGLVYPDANGYIQPWDSVVEGYSENSSITAGTTDWTWYEGQLFTAPNTNTWGATPVLISDSNSGTVLFDDFVIDEYDAAGQFVRRIQHIDPDPEPSAWWMLYETHAARDPFLSHTGDWKGLALDSGSSGSKSTSSTAHVGSKSLSLSGTSGKYAITNTKLNFSVKQGHQYRISGWIKGTNVAGSGANLGLRWLGFKSWDTPRPFTKASLETGFFDNDELQFYIDANVPVNIGEFGTAVANFNGRGGLAWVSDMLDIMDTYDLNAQYFHYHSAPWGIYYNVFGFPNATHYNADLANLFASRNYRDGLSPPIYALNVLNGEGSGEYLEGAQVTITAHAAPTGDVFDVWTGDTGQLADPTQATTTVTMPPEPVNVTATYRPASPILYTLTVNSGSSDGDYTEGTQVSVTADAAPTGQVFDVWTGDTGVLADPTQATTTVTMPAAVTTITATYKADTPTLYTLTVNSGSGDGDYAAATQVSVTADAVPSGQEFDVWTGDTSILADASQATTTVTMPASAATINATYKNTAPAGGADLRVSSFTSNKTSVAVGESIEFSFVTVNDGSSDATNVETTLSLPFEAEWIWGSSGCGLNTDGDVVCNVGSIPNGSQRTRDVGVRVLDAWDTTATVYSYGDETDPDTSNNSDSIELNISSGADMRVTISKSYPSGDPSVGRVANYRIRSYNDGPAPAPNAVMVFELPSDGTLHSKPSSCSINGDGDVECGFGTLNSGSYRTRTIGVRMQAVGTTTAYTSVESDANDPDWGNNDASLDVTVVP